MASKVCLTFTDENFTFETEYGYKLYFSSMLHTVNFSIRHKKQRADVRYQMRKVYHMEVDVDLLSDLLTYQNIESRGCKIITDKGELITCLNNYLLTGMHLQLRDLNEQ